MRIGIVTQPLCANYGGVLQNLALQKVLKDMGHTPLTLDLCTHLNITKTEYIKGYLINVAKCIINRRRYKYLSYNQKRPASFDIFVSEYIDTTETIKEYSASIIDKYELDCLIVGSDQVWRPRFNVYPEDMFLRFAQGKDIKKISYAASFGVDEWEYSSELTETCRELVFSFDGVSVREDSAIELCSKYLDVKAEFVLDPTLLLQQDYYNGICESVPKDGSKFIAVYALGISEEVKSDICDFARNKGLNVKYFTSDANSTLSVPEWLAVFRDASYVITDSFHGTAFSIIYQKDFVVLTNSSRGSSRFLSILNIMGLNDRLKDNNNLNMDSLACSIDWNSVNRKRDRFIQISLAYLQKKLQ